MINIYCGRESLNKEKFIFETIKNKGGQTLVIVPDQYTVEGEKVALEYLQEDVLMDVEIVSLSRMGSRLIEKYGGGDTTFINRYGRLMLITKITSDLDKELKVYGDVSKKTTFLEAIDDLVSQLKQNNISVDELEKTASNQEGLFGEKLSDMAKIYGEYENRIQGKYTDAEDYISLYASNIKQSEQIKDSTIWIYGFDNFTCRNRDVIRELAVNAKEVNLVINYDKNCIDEGLFELSEKVIRDFKKIADEENLEFNQRYISEDYTIHNKSAGIKALESRLFADIPKPVKDCEGVEIVKCANIYNEAETAAAYIRNLTKSEGLKYGDIMVINNDQDVRASIINRTFEEYEIETFQDNRRPVISSPIAIFIIALAETVIENYRTGDIFKVLKTGLSHVTRDETETLENYGIKYRIKGNMWKKPFTKGAFEYGEEGLGEIEEIRKKAISIFTDFEDIYRKAETYSDFLSAYYHFLIEKTPILEKTQDMMEKQSEKGYVDKAEITEQAFSAVMSVFSQMNQLLGENAFDGKEFIRLITTGLSTMEIGIIPPGSDRVMIGTLQRTRKSHVKAVIVIGANEGTIPMAIKEDPIFTPEELQSLSAEGGFSDEKLRIMEENMAVYRNFSKPEDSLILLYSESDNEGEELRKSQFIERIQGILPGINEQKDVLNRDNIRDALGGRVNTLRHFTEGVRAGEKEGVIDKDLIYVGRWLKENYCDDYDRIAGSMKDLGNSDVLSEEVARELYERKDSVTGEQYVKLSPSAIERYSRCAFSHFVTYGLKPEERRIYEAGGREIGDLYHNVIMSVSAKISNENIWQTIKREDCDQYIHDAMMQHQDSYRGGVFSYDGGENYKFKRAEKVLKTVMWTLVEHVKQGRIKESAFEIEFSRKGKIPPIEMKFDKCKVYIEGKIDRVDITESDRVKIIDYKTGTEAFDIKEAEKGYRLQLLLYLAAAQNTGRAERKPAGVFYFLIKEPSINAGDVSVDLSKGISEEISEEIDKKIRKNFKLDGIMVDDQENLLDLTGAFSGYSDVVKLRKLKDGTIKSTAREDSKRSLLSEEEFSQLQRQVNNLVADATRRLIGGEIKAVPMRTDNRSTCDFCEYRGICRFDTEFEGCKYKLIK